ncbi:MAG: FAD-dependent oxidoreductase [Hungatella sp.]|jgi:flavocytochrome c|nr:FAD-dependent oxidoreductase [Hungatella sp.]
MKKRMISWGLAAAVALSLTACSSGQTGESTSTAESTTAAQTTAAETTEAKQEGVSGTFTGSSAGMQGTVSVELTVENGVITDVAVTENHETPSLTAVVFQRIPAQIVEYQTTTLDAVTGATFASNALMRAASEAAEEAGLDMAQLEANAYHAQPGSAQAWDTDILVVGGGGAGLSAAITAAQEGSRVILVEKSSFLGGNTMMAGGGYNTVDPEAQAGMILTPAQKNTMDGYLALDPADEALKLDQFPEWKDVLTKLQDEIRAFYAANEGKEPGVDMPGFDSAALHMWHIYVGGLRELNDGTWVASDIDMARTLAEESLSAFQWMESIGIDAKTGAEASDTVFTVLGAMWPRTHAVSADKPLIDALETAAKDAGVTIYTETAAVSLITDDAGRVIGAQAEQADGTKVTINTAKGVILASGGYCANAPMVKEYDKYWGDDLSDHTLTTNVGTNTGDGIVMAQAVGADVTGMEIAQMMPSSSPLKGTLSDGIWGDASEQIWIDGEGKRFVNEYAERDVLTKASLGLENGVFYIIYAGHGDDAGVCKGAAMGDTCFGKDVQTMWDTNQIWYGATLAEAAKATENAIGGSAPSFTEEQLREVIETYNGYVDAQKDDDFGKEVISGKIDLEAVDANPDLGICITPRKASLHHTMGGIVIDTNAKVLDKDGNAIAGLWAAGEVTGGIHAGNRLGGNAEADVFTFGRIAGHSAAAAE